MRRHVNECFQVDDSYGEHHDFIHAQSLLDQGPRDFTVLLYLNDVTDGGETYFKQIGVKVHPKRGRMLIWPNVDYHHDDLLNKKTMHASLPVNQVEKFAASVWVHKGDFRTTMTNN